MNRYSYINDYKHIYKPLTGWLRCDTNISKRYFYFEDSLVQKEILVSEEFVMIWDWKNKESINIGIRDGVVVAREKGPGSMCEKSKVTQYDDTILIQHTFAKTYYRRLKPRLYELYNEVESSHESYLLA